MSLKNVDEMMHESNAITQLYLSLLFAAFFPVYSLFWLLFHALAGISNGILKVSECVAKTYWAATRATGSMESFRRQRKIDIRGKK